MPVPASAGNRPCGRCQLEPPPWEAACAPLAYAFPVDAAIRGLKFRHQLWLAPALASLVRPRLAGIAPDYDALVPVPLHRLRHALRGYNQADELARLLARGTGLPVSRCVRRRRPTRPQSDLGLAERRRNLKHAFALRRPLPGSRLLLLDDVLTTGTTLAELARLLTDAGATRIGVLTVARTIRGQ